MKVIKIILVNIYITHGILIFSQDVKRNFAYFEFGGNGILNSLNYERLLFINEKQSFRFSSRIGTGFYKSTDSGPIVMTVPLELLIWLGKSKFHPEFGLGYTPSFGKRTYIKNNIIYKQTNFDYNLLFRIGIRFQSYNDRFLVKLGLTPVVYRDYYDNSKTKMMLWGGISMGIGF